MVKRSVCRWMASYTAYQAPTGRYQITTSVLTTKSSNFPPSFPDNKETSLDFQISNSKDTRITDSVPLLPHRDTVPPLPLGQA
jgi:hypothetical protein